MVFLLRFVLAIFLKETVRYPWQRTMPVPVRVKIEFAGMLFWTLDDGGRNGWKLCNRDMAAAGILFDCLPFIESTATILYMNFRSFVFDDFRSIRNAPQSNAKRRLCIYNHTTSGLGLWLLLYTYTLIMAISQRKHKKAESNSNKRSSVVFVVAVFMLDGGQKTYTRLPAYLCFGRAVETSECVYDTKKNRCRCIVGFQIYISVFRAMNLDLFID